MARFNSAPPSARAQLIEEPASKADLGEIFDGSTIDRGPLSALDELRQHRQWVAWRC